MGFLKKIMKIQYIYKHQSLLMRMIGKFAKHFYKMVPTSIGHTIFLPIYWNHFPHEVKDIILIHEQAHIKQQQRYGWPLYLFLTSFIFPVLYCPFRLHWEKEAWEDTIHQVVMQHKDRLFEDTGFQWFVSQIDLFYTIRSGWMWMNKKAVYNWLYSVIYIETQPYMQFTQEEIQMQLRTIFFNTISSLKDF